METTKEISALFSLIDDPDEEVFGLVSNKIVNYGHTIIPNLEHLWETTPDETTQQRIEKLIHRLHFTDLRDLFREWGLTGHHSLATGALLTGRFRYPDLHSEKVLQELEKVRRNIWLELNNYLTPLEQINVVTSILYSYYGLKGTETNLREPDEFLLHKTLESKRGNQLGNGSLYLSLCELLDIPVQAIFIPRQFILAYFKPGYSQENLADPRQKIEFFIDPASGQAFSHTDVDSYFKRIAVNPEPRHFKPARNQQVISHILGEFGRCFDNDKERYKMEEIEELRRLLANDSISNE